MSRLKRFADGSWIVLLSLSPESTRLILDGLRLRHRGVSGPSSSALDGERFSALEAVDRSSSIFDATRLRDGWARDGFARHADAWFAIESIFMKAELCALLNRPFGFAIFLAVDCSASSFAFCSRICFRILLASSFVSSSSFLAVGLIATPPKVNGCAGDDRAAAVDETLDGVGDSGKSLRATLGWYGSVLGLPLKNWSQRASS